VIEANFPLIPLNAVLFPGATLPLHIFEKRYRVLVGTCLERDTPFGVAMIREGREVGGPAVPCAVGTTARIIEMMPLVDGRMNITVVGVRRMRILDSGESQGHPVALVEYLDDPQAAASVPEETLLAARERFSTYLELTRSVGRQPVPTAAALPKDPVLLSYAIARSLAADLRVKQQLLECPTAAERLLREITLLEGAERGLRSRPAGDGQGRAPGDVPA
jgi:Lon protease-like protein